MKNGFLIINLFIKYLLKLISAFRHDRVTGLFSPARNSYKSRQNEVEHFRHWTLEGKRTNKMNPTFSPSELRDNFLSVIGSRTQAEQESSTESKMERLEFWAAEAAGICQTGYQRRGNRCVSVSSPRVLG